jgi:hypothetical protein
LNIQIGADAGKMGTMNIQHDDTI